MNTYILLGARKVINGKVYQKSEEIVSVKSFKDICDQYLGKIHGNFVVRDVKRVPSKAEVKSTMESLLGRE